ncbi:SDR family NAD(P)-dependent oxidoreductase [Acidocella aminolytica]|uniref:3-oxoacyl-(Acyl carrier protein) reductase/phosphotransferase n=1 Tax=Acidocella aminolytica 101 = DSM 11237 TaxID=1120923 RepID=A0A0D6PDN6_9PROT|nr:SDR family NAD(P)-dependent oxidoreductase [Acidocella aminolytica]GAN78979.1 3-oxoacyl-(acyl carrier protein) reductase/phosphotransferase [Acidocella aminolytica 101 = DSM 11237]SHF10703.1 short chain dehydrogenase [Acidocella aminolytica 101 = DSM 11237]
MSKPAGKVAVVTGASKGIGAAIVKARPADSVIDTAVKAFGRLDVLLNISGVYEIQSIEAVTEDYYHKIFDVNELSALLTMRAAVRYLGEGESMINISLVVTSIPPLQSVV